MNTLNVLVDLITEVMAAGYTQIRVYTDTTDTGSFATLAGTVTLLGGQESYEFVDVNGTPGVTWYKTTYFGTTPGESAKSAALLGGTSSSYASVREFKAQVGKVADTSDVEIQLILDAARQVIDRFCNRPDGFVANVTPAARTFPGSGSFVQYVDQFVAVSLVEVKSSPSSTTWDTWASGDYVPFTGDAISPNFNPLPSHPYSGLMVTATGTSRIFTSGLYSNAIGFSSDMARMSNNGLGRNTPTVRVTARWGYALTCPPVIKQACLAQASRWWKRGSSAWNDSMANDAGVLTYRKEIDPDLKLMLVHGRMVKPAVG